MLNDSVAAVSNNATCSAVLSPTQTHITAKKKITVQWNKKCFTMYFVYDFYADPLPNIPVLRLNVTL